MNPLDILQIFLICDKDRLLQNHKFLSSPIIGIIKYYSFRIHLDESVAKYENYIHCKEPFLNRYKKTKIGSVYSSLRSIPRGILYQSFACRRCSMSGITYETCQEKIVGFHILIPFFAFCARNYNLILIDIYIGAASWLLFHAQCPGFVVQSKEGNESKCMYASMFENLRRKEYYEDYEYDMTLISPSSLILNMMNALKNVKYELNV
jgi:hypothetical protein